MSDFTDKAQDKADELGGKVKDVAGDLTDDSSMQAEGKVDQATAQAKQAADQVGDAARDVADDVSGAVRNSRGVVSALHRAGIKGEWAYAASFASIGLSLGSWFISRNKSGDDKAQSDRWGIFIGHWAPTFMALGIALKLEED